MAAQKLDLFIYLLKIYACNVEFSDPSTNQMSKMNAKMKSMIIKPKVLDQGADLK